MGSRDVVRRELRLADGRTLVVFDTGEHPAGSFTLVWHHGSPHTGTLLEPLVSMAKARGIRLVSYARPSYGGSSPAPGRTVAAAAADVAQLADELGIERFAVMGSSGGGPHALACAALLPGRVTGVACLASLAPFTQDFDWFAGMASDRALRAAVEGREARAELALVSEFDESVFTPADWAALSGAWEALGADAGAAASQGPDGLVDDDVAFVRPWGFDMAQIEAPVLVVHGGQDRMVPAAHGRWLVQQCPRPELWLRPLDGHVSILEAAPLAMEWLCARTNQA